MCEEHDDCECCDKWWYITAIVAIVVFGIYKTSELYFDRIEILQKQSQVVIEK